MSKRIDRMCDAYQKELSEILHFRVRDPRLEGVYITNVVFTPDLRLAKIYFEILGGRTREHEVIQGFEKSKGYLKRELSSRVKIKYAPDLKFYYDESKEVKEKIDELFHQIDEENEKSEENQPA